MGFFGDIVKSFPRIAGDVMTFGTNELLGNPIGKMADQIMNPNALSPQDEMSYNLAQQNIALEKEFAQHGLTWRIQDAAANGISPLAAIGASGVSYSPVSAAFTGPDVSARNIGLGALAGFGQDVGRSLLATKSAEERTANALELSYRTKQNELLDVQIAQAKLNLAKQAGTGPGMPLAYTPMLNRDGSVSMMPSEEAARQSHGDMFGPMSWYIHNGLFPAFQDVGRAANAYMEPLDARGTRLLEIPGLPDSATYQP